MMFFKQRPISESAYHVETVEHDGLALAIHESMCEYNSDIIGKIPVAISNCYEMYICDTTKTEEQKIALFEGVITDAWEKIKAFFKKIAEKLKSWWNSIVKYFQTIFLSNKKFIEKYKDDITGKETDKFTYEGYEYSGRDKLGGLKNIVNNLVKKAEDFTKTLASKQVEYNAAKDFDYKKLEKDGKASIDGIAMQIAKDGSSPDGKGNTSKFKEALIKTIRGGSEKKEIKNFSKGMSVDDMVDFLENGQDKLDDIKELATDVSEAANDFADAVDTFKGKIKDGEADADQKTASTKNLTCVSNIQKYALSYGTAACEAAKQLVSEMINQSSSVLRSLARHTPAKESYYNYDSRNKTSLLETFSAGF